MSSSAPGCVFIQTGSEDPEKENEHSKKCWVGSSKGHIATNNWVSKTAIGEAEYLYNKIREFCPGEAKDIVCSLLPQALWSCTDYIL